MDNLLGSGGAAAIGSPEQLPESIIKLQAQIAEDVYKQLEKQAEEKEQVIKNYNPFISAWRSHPLDIFVKFRRQLL